VGFFYLIIYLYNMNTSYSKVRHIQESNIILESRRNDSLINESQNILPPIKSNTLVPSNNSIMLSNNKKIDSVLKSNNINLNFDTNHPTYLSKVSDYFVTKGFEPYLSINTSDIGQNNSISAGLTFSVPKTDISFNLQNGYFGADLPFIKGSNLSLGYTPQGSGGGFRNSEMDSQFKGNSKYSVSLTIPIGK
jgi:hypothetical protein